MLRLLREVVHAVAYGAALLWWPCTSDAASAGNDMNTSTVDALDGRVMVLGAGFSSHYLAQILDERVNWLAASRASEPQIQAWISWR